MKSVRFVCLFAILISMLVLAQSNRSPVVDQPNGISIAQQRHPALLPNLSQMPQGVPFSQRGVRAFKAHGTRRGISSSGLNFAPAVAYSSGGLYASSVAVADVNGDGKPDIVVTNCGVMYSGCGYKATVGVLLSNGDGTFQTAVIYGSGGYHASSVAVADVNGDGKPDLLVANCSDGGCTNGTVGVLLGNGDGTFKTAVTYGTGGYFATSVAVADVNGDGKPDLLVANECSDDQCATNGTVGVLLGNGDETFQTAVSYDSGGLEASSVAVADVNGDGKPDLLVANGCVSSNNCTNGTVGVLLGNGDGTFQTAVTYGSGGHGTDSVVVADVNGDSKPDIVVANYCASSNDCSDGMLGVLLGNGDGTFQAAVTYGESSGYATSVAVADVNGDGKPDLVVTNLCISYYNCANGTVGVLINTSLTATTTTLASSPNPSNFGQAVTFTATVTAQPGFDKGTPTGTVSFYDGTTNIGNSNLNSGVATLTTSTLSVGRHSMAATYNGDTNFAPSTSPVQYQVVQGAIASVSPTSLNFGNQTVGITSTPQVVTLTNTGNINLTITSIQITGTNSGDFGQTNNCPGSVSPNKGCQISVTFTPTARGIRNAAVSITDNAPGSPQSVPLTGVGVVPTVTFSPDKVTFPTQLIFTTSKTESVKLANTGLGILILSKIVTTGPFRQTNDCPSHLKHGEHCTISVKFHPTTKGVLNGSVEVTDNAPGSPQKVALTGTATYVQLRPMKLNFGVQPVGTKSLPKTVALTNQGHQTLNIMNISITGIDAKDFAETNTCGKSVASGASCFIKVTFKPLAKGKRMANVSVYDNGGGSPQQAMLIGTGT
jgi:Bacterial Ig-like domain (group 3)/FG-GAP-like repeat/Abnormal spindle-like microcephaly-assoc'd, ASPM-SPD-2-Hydin